MSAEFPGLLLNAQASGYRDNEATAAASLDPGDTAFDLAAQGRLDGYALEFADPAAFSSGTTGRPISATVSVELFVTPLLAQAAMVREFAEIERSMENEVAGITFKEFQRLGSPDLGSSALAGRLTINIEALNADTISSFVSWQRGRVVASVGVTALEDEVDSSSLERLATRVDERIEGVQTGKIIVVAPLVIPTATPVPSPSPTRSVATLEESARGEGYDLEAMVLALSELPATAIVTREGFVEQPGTISSYSREFGSQEAFLVLGASRVANIGATVILHTSESNAAAQVSVLEAIGPEQFGQSVAAGFPASEDLTAESFVSVALELPPIGDLRAGFLVEFEIGEDAFQEYFVFFAQGQILGQLLLIGPEVALEDTVALARLMEARIRDNTPE